MGEKNCEYIADRPILCVAYFMKYLILFALLMTAVLAEEKTEKAVPTMPEDVTLTSGRVLHHVSVVRWEKDRVVLKYSGGIDPIAFSLIKSISREDLVAIRDIANAKEQIQHANTKEAATRLQLIRENPSLATPAESTQFHGQIFIVKGVATAYGTFAGGDYGQYADFCRSHARDFNICGDRSRGRSTHRAGQADRGKSGSAVLICDSTSEDGGVSLPGSLLKSSMGAVMTTPPFFSKCFLRCRSEVFAVHLWFPTTTPRQITL